MLRPKGPCARTGAPKEEVRVGEIKLEIHQMTTVAKLLEMTTVAKLLGRKQRLLERLQENPGPHERDEAVRLLMQIETALDLVEETGPAQTERIGS